MGLMEDWNSIKDNLIKTINTIFANYDINQLSCYEKRRIIYEYLANTLSYDYDTLDKINDFKKTGNPVARNNIQELYNVMYNKKGLCNAISQYYKLLLEQVGIKAYCVICDDGTLVKHQLNLVYDDDNDSYSFDDVTSVIVQRGDISDFFDYDIAFANSVNQGKKIIMNSHYFFVLPEDLINYLVKRKESLCEKLVYLPDNIVSKKNIKKIK